MDVVNQNESEASVAVTLASAMGAALTRTVDFHMTTAGMTSSEALTEALRPNPNLAEELRVKPPDKLAWIDLARATSIDSELAAEIWAGALDQAKGELATGHRSARVIDAIGTPWERAKYLALRQSLRDEWHPAGGIESTLIDSMAQAWTLQEFWTEVLLRRSSAVANVEKEDLKHRGVWPPPQQDAADALEQAAVMVDRFNKVFARTLRSLREIRRTTPVTVRRAGQVNVGGQQVNVAYQGADNGS